MWKNKKNKKRFEECCLRYNLHMPDVDLYSYCLNQDEITVEGHCKYCGATFEAKGKWDNSDLLNNKSKKENI